MIPILHSAKNIERRFYTGEEPVLVECSDRNSYICKYSRFAGSANKLVCELLGAKLARDWRLHTPNIAIVNILLQHVPQDMSGSWFSLPTLGSLRHTNAIDMPSFIHDVKTTITCVKMWDTDPMFLVIPAEWNVNKAVIESKLNELISDEWVSGVKENFMQILNNML